MEHLKFLVVENTITALEGIRALLKSIDYSDVIGTTDCEEAFNEIMNADGTIGFVIISDNILVSLRQDFIDFFSKIKDNDKLARLPILMITTYNHNGDQFVIRALADRLISNLIAKPFTPEHLKEKIEDILKNLQKQNTPEWLNEVTDTIKNKEEEGYKNVS